MSGGKKKPEDKGGIHPTHIIIFLPPVAPITATDTRVSDTEICFGTSEFVVVFFKCVELWMSVGNW